MNGRFSFLHSPFVRLLVLIFIIALLGYFSFRGVKWVKDKPFLPRKLEISCQTDSNYYTNELGRYFDHLHRANLFNGAVLVARHDTIIFQKQYGWSNMHDKIWLSDSSAFQLASVTKPLTATAVLQLVEKKKIRLDDPVKKYLSLFPYEDITVKNLLQHSSGIQDYTRVPVDSFPFPDSLCSNVNVLKWLSLKKPIVWFKPGARFMYCNTNYALLALVVEEASGKNFETYLQKNIFYPLDMAGASLLPPAKQGRTTLGHTHSGALVQNDYYDQVYGDKGVYATCLDMYKFSRGWFEGKIVSEATASLAVSDSIYARRHNKFYGLGWRITFDETGRKCVYHNGWWHGYRSAFQRRMTDEVTVVILSNKLNTTVYRATQSVFDILDGLDPKARKGVSEEE